jgi:hypothetical protein
LSKHGSRSGRLRLPRLSRRIFIGLVVCLAAIAAGSVMAFGAIVGTPNSGHLVAFGPISATDGFPTWYKDDTGRRLELCLDAQNSLCGFLPGDVPDPSKPISFPDNFPEEAFYMLAGNTIDLAGGGRMATTLGLEAAFATDVAQGDQMVFGRVRFYIDGLTGGADYTITHPYGVDKLKAQTDGTIRYTQDVGIAPGQFGGALNSRIGPFLKWDPAVTPAAPDGYIGDPDQPHKVVGSPYNTNYVQIVGPNVGSPTTQCNPLPAGVTANDCAQVDEFSLQGKIATNGGVEVSRATYSRTATSSMIDVFATSDIDPQSIEVSGTGIDVTRMRGEQGRYDARVAFTGSVPAEVTVKNVGDQPVATKTAPVTDLVTARASYDADTQTMTINATSSDEVDPPALTATGYGPVGADGVLVAPNVAGAPAELTVTSAAGGRATVPVTMTGGAFAAIPVSAFAGVNLEAVQGTTATLDGTGSSGPVTGYSWTQTAGPTVDLTDAATPKPTFTAPAVPTDGDATLTFELTVTGAGGPQTSTVDVHVVSAAVLPVLDAGAAQTVNQDVAVTLDASATTGANSYAWKQLSGTAVALAGANTAKPTFRSPKKGGVLTFEVTATGPGGPATGTVDVTVRNNALTTTTVQYIQSKREWRIDGTSNVPGPGLTVTAHNGDLTAPQINATVNVDTLGNWSIRGAGPAPTSLRRISIESSGGGTLLNVPVTLK